MFDTLLDSKLEPAGFERLLRNMRQEADLYHEADIPLFTQESKNGNKIGPWIRPLLVR